MHEACKAWIAPERAAGIEDYLKRIERIVRAGLLADRPPLGPLWHRAEADTQDGLLEPSGTGRAAVAAGSPDDVRPGDRLCP